MIGSMNDEILQMTELAADLIAYLLIHYKEALYERYQSWCSRFLSVLFSFRQFPNLYLTLYHGAPAPDKLRLRKAQAADLIAYLLIHYKEALYERYQIVPKEDGVREEACCRSSYRPSRQKN